MTTARILNSGEMKGKNEFFFFKENFLSKNKIKNKLF